MIVNDTNPGMGTCSREQVGSEYSLWPFEVGFFPLREVVLTTPRESCVSLYLSKVRLNPKLQPIYVFGHATDVSFLHPGVVDEEVLFLASQ